MDFNSYVTKYSADLTRLCMSLCGNRADADDLFQETWLKAMKGYSKYDNQKAFDKWLFAICVNTYKNSLKHSWNSRRYTFGSDEEKTQFFNSIPEINNENQDEYNELHIILMNLPKKQRVVVALYYFKDYSIADISQILKIPEGTVKSRLSSARATIKRRISNE